MSDMHEDITAQVAYDKGLAERIARGDRQCNRVVVIKEDLAYEKGFVAGKKHAHDLLTEYIDSLKHKRAVTEAEGLHVVGNVHMTMGLQKQINALEHAKLLIRTGHWTGDPDTD